MLETSKDLLYVVLAFCFLWLTIFLSWLLCYFIAIVRDVSRLTGQVRSIIERVDSLTRAVHERFESGAATFTAVGAIAKEVVSWALRERAAKMGEKRRKKSSDDEE